MRNVLCGAMVLTALLAAGVCRSQSFGGSFVVTGSHEAVGFPAVMQAPHDLTIDSCAAAYGQLAQCQVFPDLEIRDKTSGAIICAAHGARGPQFFVSVPLITDTVAEGDFLVVENAGAPYDCSPAATAISISINYH